MLTRHSAKIATAAPDAAANVALDTNPGFAIDGYNQSEARPAGMLGVLHLLDGMKKPIKRKGGGKKC